MKRIDWKNPAAATAVAFCCSVAFAQYSPAERIGTSPAPVPGAEGATVPHPAGPAAIAPEGATGVVGTTQPGDGAELAQADRRFVEEAARSGTAEVLASQMALHRASSPAVQQFAQRMIADHAMINDQLRMLAQSRGIELPARLDDRRARQLEQLNTVMGPPFDRMFVELQVRGHQKAVELFRQQAEQGRDPQLRQLAQTGLPALQQHLQIAQQIGAELQVQRAPQVGPGSIPAAGQPAAAVPEAQPQPPQRR
ncbi:MAG TPA: DUF4142 domain-containing protein [Burkholderiaceae bacterium]|nr:DUF4142 domain-containing protein [Burkholderiaceae bacterium]